MKTFLKTINALFNFNKCALQARMDLYVASKQPNSVSDVERILKEYDRYVSKGGLYL